MKRFIYLMIFSLALVCNALNGYSQGEDHINTMEVVFAGDEVTSIQTPLYDQVLDDPQTGNTSNTDSPPTVVSASDDESSRVFITIWEWIKLNWGEALLGLLGIIEIIVMITPTEKDNAWFKWLRDFLQGIIPNRKAGGGLHSY